MGKFKVLAVGDHLELDDTYAGMHINTACENAITAADEANKPVHFKFNDTPVVVQPGETVKTVVARWDAEREAAHQKWINSDEYKEQEARREAEAKAAREAVMVDKSVGETEMREADVPWPKTEKQLLEYIKSLVERQHDYGTCVYAASMAATAAFYYVSGQLGITGFQASCADLDFIRRSRHIKGPFILLKGEDALYPQYDLHEKLNKALEEWEPWLKEEAEKKLTESGMAHPNVREHWKTLAK